MKTVLVFKIGQRNLLHIKVKLTHACGNFQAITDTMLVLINEIPDAVEPGLLHLCEFIEDCEFTYLSTQVRPRAKLTDFEGFFLKAKGRIWR